MRTVVVGVENVIEDMTMAETERRGTRVQVLPVVVSKGDGDRGILCAIVVRVSNEGSLDHGSLWEEVRGR